MRSMRGTLGILACVVATEASAQSPIPIRELTPAIGTDSGVVANVYVLRGLKNGSVLLNDAIRHRLVLFDSTLKKFVVVADAEGTAPNSFGPGNNGGLLPFPDDSTAFIDAASKALIVVGTDGRFGRVTSPPHVNDISFYNGNGSGGPGFDKYGRLYYRITTGLPKLPPFTKPDTIAVAVDSAAIVRADFETGAVDTIARVRVPTARYRVYRFGPMSQGYDVAVNPVPVTDDWTFFPDGTLALIRGQDYHIDWVAPDGSRRSTPKMAFDWRKLGDDEKQRIIDSTRASIDSISAGNYARAVERAAANKQPPPPPPMKRELLGASELPDYFPAIRAGSQVRVDPDGNMWVLPATSLQARGGLLFDVINRNGQIIERVQLPAGRNLQGFSPGGVVYMSVPAVMQAQFGYPRIERARVVRP